MNGRLALAAAVTAAALTLTVAWIVAGSPEPQRAGMAPAIDDDPPLAGVLLHAGEPAGDFRTGLENLPASLAGSEVNDALRVDADGHLVIEYPVRALFDYFLTTVGEEPLAVVATRIRAYLAHRLQEPARGEALQLLEGYLGFWQAAGELSQHAQAMPGQAAPEAMAAYLAQLRELRSRYFSRDVVQAFFAEQDAYQAYTLARLQVMQDASLGNVERARRLGDLLAQLPPSVQEAQRAATLVQTLDEVIADCRRAGCPASEVQRIREELAGPEAAQRLAALEADEAALQARLAGYFLQRDRIAANPAYSESDRRAQTEELQHRLFDDSERLRLVALERIHDGRTTTAE
ncbi:MAG: lipase secretion chaperone [Pseudomonadota bacterium]